MPVMISSSPNNFFRTSSWISLLMKLPINTLMQPARIPGHIALISMMPCFHRKIVAARALGRKNSKLIILAIWYSVPATAVNHSSNKLPPPTPRPAKMPRIVLMSTGNKISTINIAARPIESTDPILCADRGLGSFLPKTQPRFPQCHRPTYTARQYPRGS